MNTTSILDEEVGIQRQGFVDKTETNAVNQLNPIIFIGQFKRGRMDVPMTIHQGNIEAELGYDPDNPDYIAVQDALDVKAPSVRVLRIKTLGSDGDVIGCEGATHEVIINSLTYGGIYSVKVNGILIGTMSGQQMTETTFANGNVTVEHVENPDSWDFPLGHFRNNGPDFVRFEVMVVDAEQFSGHHEDPPNESLIFGMVDGHEGRKITFCLAPAP